MIVPQISSSRFVHKAKFDGVVVDVVPNETMTVKYNNGKTEILDILPRRSEFCGLLIIIKIHINDLYIN